MPVIVFELFSNLKNFCAHDPRYSYNTLNNYLSKQKVAFENETIHVERKQVIGAAAAGFRFTPVVRKIKLGKIDEEQEDAAYWLSKPAKGKNSCRHFYDISVAYSASENG